MPSMPWRAFGTPRPDQDYAALLSYLPLKSVWRVPSFMIYTVRVMKQLASAEGLVGYSLLAHPLAKNFWTLSVWQSEAALQSFVRGAPHRSIMASLGPHMLQTAFVRWPIRGSELPLGWENALGRLNKSPRV